MARRHGKFADSKLIGCGETGKEWVKRIIRKCRRVGFMTTGGASSWEAEAQEKGMTRRWRKEEDNRHWKRMCHSTQGLSRIEESVEQRRQRRGMRKLWAKGWRHVESKDRQE
jgi:hypothetical protein